MPINKNTTVFPNSVIEKALRVKISGLDGHIPAYGWGWVHSSIDGVNSLMHTGGFDGTAVQVTLSPQDNIGVVVVHNESGMIANELNQQITQLSYRILLDKNPKKQLDKAYQNMVEVAAWIKNSKQKIASKRNDLLREQAKYQDQLYRLLGEYVHKNAGRLSIKQVGNLLTLYWGDLKGIVYPAPESDDYLVELRPGKFYAMTKTGDESTGITLNLKGWDFKQHID